MGRLKGQYYFKWTHGITLAGWTCICVYIYIYIYITYVHMCIYIYIYIYITQNTVQSELHKDSAQGSEL